MCDDRLGQEYIPFLYPLIKAIFRNFQQSPILSHKTPCLVPREGESILAMALSSLPFLDPRSTRSRRKTHIVESPAIITRDFSHLIKTYFHGPDIESEISMVVAFQLEQDLLWTLYMKAQTYGGVSNAKTSRPWTLRLMDE